MEAVKMEDVDDIMPYTRAEIKELGDDYEDNK